MYLSQLLFESGSYLHADGAYIFYQGKNVHKIEDVLNDKFLIPWEWFTDNNLSIPFGEYKRKCILFSNTKGSSKLIVSYGNHTIKHYHIVEYLGCHLDFNLSGEPLAMKV